MNYYSILILKSLILLFFSTEHRLALATRSEDGYNFFKFATEKEEKTRNRIHYSQNEIKSDFTGYSDSNVWEGLAHIIPEPFHFEEYDDNYHHYSKSRSKSSTKSSLRTGYPSDPDCDDNYYNGDYYYSKSSKTSKSQKSKKSHNMSKKMSKKGSKCHTLTPPSPTPPSPTHVPIPESSIYSWEYIDENDETELQGFYSTPQGDGPFPVVVIVPDWDGVNDYEKERAIMVANEMGYIGFAADIYGKDLNNIDDMGQHIELSSYYRENPSIFIGRIQAAVEELKLGLGGSIMVETDKIALIGYCFGGTGALMYALSGEDDALGVVSVHGGLMPFEINSDPVDSPRVLVLSGGDDDTYTDVSVLEDTFNNANNTWEITRYSHAEHGFTDFYSDAYNYWADMRSWESTTTWLHELFGFSEYVKDEPESFNVISVDYDDVDGDEMIRLRGYLSLPEGSFYDAHTQSRPLVVIIHDGDGVNDYEKKRATMLSDLGYIAFAADIFGVDYQNITDYQQLTKYLNNEPLYIQRMQRAIDVASSTELAHVDTQNIAIIGYCFGGSGAVLYARSGADSAKIAVAFHGNFYDEEVPVMSDIIHPYTLVLSGGDDPQHKNQTHLERVLNEGDAEWEITGYSDIGHRFTYWPDPESYDVVADNRSWNSMKEVFEARLVHI